MSFEVRHALQSLEKKTPSYFLQEIFSHGTLKVRIEALEVLKRLDPEHHSSRILRKILKLT